MGDIIDVSKPTTVVLTPDELALVVFAVKKLPYENVADFMAKLRAACAEAHKDGDEPQ